MFRMLGYVACRQLMMTYQPRRFQRKRKPTTGRGIGLRDALPYSLAMSPLPNQRHEGFARAICRGEAASTAYGSIYHVTGRVAEANGWRLLRNAEVADRIAELKGMAAQRTEKTVASLVADLDEAIVFAKQCKNPTAVVAAITAQARLLGLEAPRQLEVIHKPAPLPTKVLELSEEEWMAQFGTGSGPKKALTQSVNRSKAEKQTTAALTLNEASKTIAASKTIDWDDETEETEQPIPGAIYLD